MRLTSRPQASRRQLLCIGGAILLALTAGCGGDSSKDPAPGLTVSWVAPSNSSQIAGSVDLIAEARNAERVVFRVDDQEVGRDDSSPYIVSWLSTQVTNGNHRLTAEAERGSDRAKAEVTVGVANPGGGDPITVAVLPPTVELALSATQQFQANVTGSSNTNVTWTVLGGNARGTISSDGLYTAPATLPAPASAVVRATSAADPSQFGEAVVTLTDSGTGIPPAQEQALQATFELGANATQSANGAVADVAQTVFAASGLNGNRLTTTGTLTQANGEFTYSAAPNDKLVVLLQNGTRIELTIQAFEGDFSGSFEDFRDFHSDLRFRYFVAGLADVTVASVSGSPGLARAPGDVAGRRTNIAYTRQIGGSVVLSGVGYSVDATLSGSSFSDVSPPFVEIQTEERFQGTLTGNGAQITTDETYSAHSFFNSKESRFVVNFIDRGTSTLAIGGVEYRFQDLFVKREKVNGKVTEPDFWVASGTLSRNGAQIGVVRYETAAVIGTTGPRIVLDLGGGRVLVL